MKVVIGSDHGGYELKEYIKKVVEKLGYEVEDKGTDSEKSVDYPLYAEKVAKEVAKSKDKLGILICGTGEGMCMAANKVKGVRAALVYNKSTAKLAKEHNNANVMCLGGREITKEQGEQFTKIFIETPYSEEERHTRRISEILRIENE